jgi:hypothetical protein
MDWNVCVCVCVKDVVAYCNEVPQYLTERRHKARVLIAQMLSSLKNISRLRDIYNVFNPQILYFSIHGFLSISIHYKRVPQAYWQQSKETGLQVSLNT